MSLVLEKPASGNFLPPATLKQGLHQVVISNIEDLGMVPLGADILAKNRAQAVKEGRDPNSVKTEQPKARFFFSNAIGEWIAKDYTVSLNDRAGLKIDMDAIGKKLQYGDSLLSVIGTQAQLLAVNATSRKGTKYVKIGTITEPAPGQKVPLPAVRPTTPEKGAGAPAPSFAPSSTSVSADEIPF